MISQEEFFTRAKDVQVDKTSGRQLRQLYVENGTMLQVVSALVNIRDQLRESLSKNLIISDESVRVAIGIQGQIMGVETTLNAIWELMNIEPEAEEDGRNNEPERRAP